MKRILITGSNGLLGQKLVDLLKSNPEVALVATSKGPDRYPDQGNYEYHPLDITDRDAVMATMGTLRPDVIINTAAMTNVDACETQKDACTALNVDSVRHLIEAADRFGIHFIHLSTDFVFDGLSGPYVEDDIPNPLSWYGFSKLESEKLTMQSSGKWTIIRTIIVYGVVKDMSRSNIVLWAKTALETRKEINVVDDQFRNPTLAEDLAAACAYAAIEGVDGLFHVSGKDFMSIIDLVTRVANHFKLDASLIKKISSSTLNQAAKRPARTGFNIEKAVQLLNYAPHSFEEGLEVVERQLVASMQTP